MTSHRRENPANFDLNLETLDSLYGIDLDAGLAEYFQAKELMIDLGLKKIHGELLVTPDGDGLLIMGEAAAGKSRLALALIQNHPDYKFSADDFPLVAGRGGSLYGGYDPEKPNSHRFITYNSNAADPKADKTRFPIPERQLEPGFVRIKKLLFLRAGEAESLEVLPVSDPKQINQLLNASITALTSDAGLADSVEGIEAYVLRAPKNNQDWVAELAELLGRTNA
jgi:hypothetical protein